MRLAALGSTFTVAALVVGLAPAAEAADGSPPPSSTAPSVSEEPSSSPAGTATSDPTTAPSTAPTTTPTTAPTVAPTSTPPTVAPPSTAPTKAPTRQAAAALSMTLNQPATTWEDRPLVFSGKLSNGVSNWYITLWQLTRSGWVLRGATRSTAGGAYRLTYTSPGPVYANFRTVVGPKYASTLAQSPWRIGSAQDRKILLNKPAPAYTALIGVVVSGRTVPADPGRQLALQDRGSNGVWRTLRYGAADAKGNFRLAFPDNLPSARSVRVVSRGVPAAQVEVSGSIVMVIKGYLNPGVYSVAASMVPKTYRSGCPVRPASLRLLKINYWGFDGVMHRGELILRDAAVQKMIKVWNASLVAKFRIRRMQRADVYGGSDIRSMEADNTSAFNCRRVTGDPYSLSPHSYGMAIDINTVENPYLAANGVWYPKNSASYRNRSVARTGMLFTGSAPTRALSGQGYFWGKNWSKPDYQHFQPR